MSTAPHSTDVAVIGAGPAGLFAVFQCGMLDLRCHVIDALEAVGGQLMALYPEKPIYDIPGHPSILAQDLVAKLEAQAAPFAPTYHLDQRAESLTRLPDGRWRITTAKGAVIEAGAVIVAAGGGAFGPNRPPLDGLEAYEGRSVFYLVKRREDFRGKRIVIGGGGDSAVDWALSLSEVAASVQVVHRRAKFRAAPESVARLEALAKDGKLELVTPCQPAALEGAEGVLTAVTVADLDGNRRRLPADVFLPFYGLASALGPLAAWGLTLVDGRLAVDPTHCATNLPGVFAIGDIADYPGKLKLILTGFADAAAAAHGARHHLRPDQVYHFEHSTTRGVPKA